MTPKERVTAAIRHQETEKVPYQIDFTQPAAAKLIQHVGDPGYIDRIGNHIASVKYGGRKEYAPGYARDHFGVVWNQTKDKDIGVIEDYLITGPSLAGYAFPEVDAAAWRALLEQAVADAGDRFLMVGLGFSMFERAWSLRGMENILMDMVAEPEFVDQLLEAICEFQLRIIDVALEYPIDGVHFGDDWGQQKGLIMGPTYWRRFIKPRVARMYERVERAGRFVSQHSCGDIQELFPDLIEMGLDVYQTFQPEIYDVPAVKREFGRDLTFWGGLSTQRALPFLSPDEVREYTLDMITIMRPGGGYIAAPTHAIPGDVPAANIVALIETLQGQ